jgi:hypothetical protein
LRQLAGPAGWLPQVRGGGACRALDGIEQVFDAGRVTRSEGSAAALGALGALAERVRPVALAREHRVPVAEPLRPLLPGGGLRRGSVVSVSAARGTSGATSLALALVAEASAAGAWVAGVGLGSLGLVAAAELGVALERFVLVAAPRPGSWPTVVAALVDGFDLVLVDPACSMRAADARRLVARARERGSILIQLHSTRAAQPPGGAAGMAPDVRLQVTAMRWEGIGAGHGHLRARRASVEAGGRGEASRPRAADLWLPGPGGSVEVALTPPTPLRSTDHPQQPPVGARRREVPVASG